MYALATITMCFFFAGGPVECVHGVRDEDRAARWITGATEEECVRRNVERAFELVEENGATIRHLHITCAPAGV